MASSGRNMGVAGKAVAVALGAALTLPLVACGAEAPDSSRIDEILATKEEATSTEETTEEEATDEASGQDEAAFVTPSKESTLIVRSLPGIRRLCNDRDSEIAISKIGGSWLGYATDDGFAEPYVWVRDGENGAYYRVGFGTYDFAVTWDQPDGRGIVSFYDETDNEYGRHVVLHLPESEEGSFDGATVPDDEEPVETAEDDTPTARSGATGRTKATRSSSDATDADE